MSHNVGHNAASWEHNTTMSHLDLMTTQDLAAYLGKPVDTIHSWRRRRVGPPGFRLGRNVVYRRSAVDLWLEALEAADPQSPTHSHDEGGVGAATPTPPIQQHASTSTTK